VSDTRNVPSAPIREQVRAFIHERFPRVRDRRLPDGASLLESGVVDSLGILDIVIHLEETYGFTVMDDELQPQNFDSIDALAAFTRAKALGGCEGARLK
jgi:acyl carrier protein